MDGKPKIIYIFGNKYMLCNEFFLWTNFCHLVKNKVKCNSCKGFFFRKTCAKVIIILKKINLKLACVDKRLK